jgi:hypothetical protein
LPGDGRWLSAALANTTRWGTARGKVSTLMPLRPSPSSKGHRYSERAARGILAEVATEWRDLSERIRQATAPAKPEWLVEGYLQSRRRSPAPRGVKDGDMPCAAICWS